MTKHYSGREKKNVFKKKVLKFLGEPEVMVPQDNLFVITIWHGVIPFLYSSLLASPILGFIKDI